MKRGAYLAIGVVVLGLAGATFVLWRQTPEPAAEAPSATPPAAETSAPVQAAASEPAIRHPLDAAASAVASSASPDVDALLAELFGRKAVLSMFQVPDFARRLVATVDNLGRAQAPARLWPLNPVPGRFTVAKRGDALLVSADNDLRYAPYVLLMESVDARRLVALYVRLYPMLQQAYEDIGYPKHYFNDRLVEVIDLLLATPDLDGAPKVHLPAINGPVQPERPWLLYEFDDPRLQALAAGQKILLRMGPVNERRVKARLGEIRTLVAAGDLPR